MRIKVCGITSVEQLEQLEAIGIDLAGLIFVESSPRYAYTQLKDRSEEVRMSKIEKAGVFVNAEMSTVTRRINEFGLSAVQLHGDESPDYANLLNNQIPVIKAFPIKGDEDIAGLVRPYQNSCTYFLFDTHTKDGDYGGTGKKFDWEKLSTAEIAKPFFLSGGISPEHAEEVKAFHHPSFFAVDINSRFEISPGVKNMGLVSAFKNKI
jgi:phosphoribosylanthranilate isomerase